MCVQAGRVVAQRVRQTESYCQIHQEPKDIDQAHHDMSSVANTLLARPTMHPYLVLTLLVFTADLCGRWLLRDTNQPLATLF